MPHFGDIEVPPPEDACRLLASRAFNPRGGANAAAAAAAVTAVEDANAVLAQQAFRPRGISTPSQQISLVDSNAILTAQAFARRSSAAAAAASSTGGSRYLALVSDGDLVAPSVVFYEGDFVTTIEATF